MERLKAGYEKLKGEINHVVAAPVMQKLMPVHGRQYGIGSRVVAENRQISEGGFAFVYLVHDVKTNEELVLKKMRCQDKASTAMAKREIQLLEQLPPHPNLVQYFGSIFLSEGKCKEVAMLFEFCPSGHLLNLLDRAEGRLSERVILETMMQIVAGVAVLHSFSPPVQHRDLKVENVLLGADGQWKLLDFGSWSDERLEPGALDKHALSQLEEQIEKYTTMMYRPPEMVDFYLEFPICQKVDIWMIGCILYTLMFYRHPFQDESTLAIANARYVWPSSPEYPEHLRDLTHWLLARDPEDRPDAELLLDLLGSCSSAEAPPVLPLPKAVQEQCDKLRRLYGEGRTSSPASRVQSPCARSQENGEEERRRLKPKKGRQNSKKRTEEIWAQADSSWPASSLAVPEPSSSWAAFGVQESEHDASSPWRTKSTWPSEDVAGDDLAAAYGDQGGFEAEEVGQSSWSFSTHATSSGSQSPHREHRERRPQRDPDTDALAQWPQLREEASQWPAPPLETTERSVSSGPWPTSERRAGSPHPTPWQGSPSHSPRRPQVATAWPAPSASTAFPFASPWESTPVASPRSSEREMPGSPGAQAVASTWPSAALAPWPDDPGAGADNFWGTAKKATPWTSSKADSSDLGTSGVAQSFPWPVRIEAPSAAPESPAPGASAWPSPWGPC